MIEGLFQPMHLLVILIVVLIVFGPGKLPELGSALGHGIREFRRSVREMSAPADNAVTTSQANVSQAPANTAGTTASVCPACGAATAPEHRFCPGCGAVLTRQA